MNKAYEYPAFLMESFVQLDGYDQERKVQDWLIEGKERLVRHLYRELCAGNYKEIAQRVARAYNAYYPTEKLI